MQENLVCSNYLRMGANRFPLLIFKHIVMQLAYIYVISNAETKSNTKLDTIISTIYSRSSQDLKPKTKNTYLATNY